MFCIHCGSEIKDDSKFCIMCGEPVPTSVKAPDNDSSFISPVDVLPEAQPETAADAAQPKRPGFSAAAAPEAADTIPISAIPVSDKAVISAETPKTADTIPANQISSGSQSIPPVKKKKKTGLIVGLVVGGFLLSVLIIGGIIASIFMINPSNKRNTPVPDGTNAEEETEFSVDTEEETTEATEEGVLKLDGIELDFGEAKIDGDAKDYIEPVDLGAEEAPDGLASELYELTLDPTSKDQITVRIPYTDNPSEEDTDAVPMLGIGRTITFDDGSTETVYQYLPAEIADQIASAAFAPADVMGELLANGSSSGKGTSAPRREHVRAGIFWCTTQFTDGGHFLVYFPAQPMKFFIDNKDRDALLKDLEAVYEKYLGLGFVYAGRTEWPMEVTVRRLSANEGAYVYGYDGAGGSIEINRDFFEGGYQPASVKPILSHEFFHFVQLNYVEYDNDCPWFDEATATYFEGEESGSVPGVVSKYQSLIFGGAIPSENTAPEGYARMPLIRFLVEKYSVDFIRAVYASAGSGTSWDSAITDIIDQPSSWAGEFYTKLTAGSYWNDQTYNLYKAVIDDSITGIGVPMPLTIPDDEEIATAAENGDPPLLGSVSPEVGSYGAQLVAVTISEDILKLLPDGVDPEVHVATGAELHVFSVKGKTVSELPAVEGTVILPDFKAASQDKTVYLALIIGSHSDGKQSYDVQVTLPLFPTLDELIGSYADGTLTIDNVFISDSLREQLAAEAAQEEDAPEEESGEGFEGIGCDIDIDILAMLEQMKGLPNPVILTIEKTGENTGNLKMTSADGETDESAAEEDTESIPFTYEQGNMVIYYEVEGQRMSGVLLARYLPGKSGVSLIGTLRLVLPDYPESDFYIDISLSGKMPFEVP